MLQHQTKKEDAKKIGSTASLQKAAKRRIKISKIKVVPAMILGPVVDTQY